MDVMDIAGLSMSMSQSNVLRDVNLALMSDVLDQAEQNGMALTKMMEASVTPNLGQNIDIRL